MVSHLYSRNGTPELCVNDQVHKFFQASLHRAINEVVGRGNLLHNRPMAQEDRRGTTPWHYALACSVVWKTFPQIILTSAFVRLRYSSPSMAAKLLDTHQKEIEDGVQFLQEWQRVVQTRTHWKCLYADQDFSGTPQDDRSLAQPTRVSTVEKIENAVMDALHAALVPTTLSALAPLGICLPDGGFSSRLEANRDRMGSALASLASTASVFSCRRVPPFRQSTCTCFEPIHIFGEEQILHISPVARGHIQVPVCGFEETLFQTR